MEVDAAEEEKRQQYLAQGWEGMQKQLREQKEQRIPALLEEAKRCAMKGVDAEYQRITKQAPDLEHEIAAGNYKVSAEAAHTTPQQINGFLQPQAIEGMVYQMQ